MACVWGDFGSTAPIVWGPGLCVSWKKTSSDLESVEALRYGNRTPDWLVDVPFNRYIGLL